VLVSRAAWQFQEHFCLVCPRALTTGVGRMRDIECQVRQRHRSSGIAHCSAMSRRSAAMVSGARFNRYMRDGKMRFEASPAARPAVSQARRPAAPRVRPLQEEGNRLCEEEVGRSA